MAKFECKECGYIFDEQQAGIKFLEITECPICASDRDVFVRMEEEEAPAKAEVKAEEKSEEKKEETKEEPKVEEKKDDASEEKKDEGKEEKAESKEEEKKDEEKSPYVIEKRTEFWLDEKDKEVEVDKSNIETYYGNAIPVKSPEQLAKEAKEKEEENRPKLDPIDGTGAVKKVIEGGDRSSDGSDPEVVVVEEAASDVGKDDDDFVFEEAVVESEAPLETEEIPVAVSTGFNDEGDFFTGFDTNPVFGDTVHTEEFIFDDEEPVGEAVEIIDPEEPAEKVEEVAEFAEEAAEEAAEEETVEEETEIVEDIAETVEEPAEEIVEEVAEEVAEEAAEEVAEAAEESVEEETEIVEDIPETVEEPAEEVVEEVAEEVVEEAAEEAAEVAEETGEEAAETPEVAEAAIAGAFGVAAAAGVVAAVAGIEETAEEAVEEVAEEMVEEAAEEATEETVEEAVEETAEAVDEIVEEAEETESPEETLLTEAEVDSEELGSEEEDSEEEISECTEGVLVGGIEEDAKRHTAVVKDAKYNLLTDAQVKSLFEQYGMGPVSNGLEGIILLPAQLDPLPIFKEESIGTNTVIGISAAKPVELDKPFGNSDMFRWGEYIPESDDLSSCENANLILIKGLNSHIPKVSGKEGLRAEVKIVKQLYDGVPVGVSLMIGRIEQDFAVCAYANVDYVILNDASSGILPYALRQAKRYLNRVNSRIQIVVSIKDVNNAQEIAKLLALGADCVLLEREYSEEETERLTAELAEIARNTGHDHVGELNMYDICTIDNDLASNTDISHF